MLLDNGCYARFREGTLSNAGRACLFLDRDGVVVEEIGYLGRREDVRLIPGAAAVVARANRLGWAVGLVTNQAGIGRGYFEWDAFDDVQSEIEALVAADSGVLDFVLACPHHRNAMVAQYADPDHAWRTPKPGMLLHAAQRLDVELPKSIMVGDKQSDWEAGRSAGVGRLIHVSTGHGLRHLTSASKSTDVTCLESIADVADLLTPR